MNKSDVQKMTEMQELMCDEYCRFPGKCNSQEELDRHCDDCQMIRLWDFFEQAAKETGDVR